jgi:septum formation protein
MRQAKSFNSLRIKDFRTLYYEVDSAAPALFTARPDHSAGHRYGNRETGFCSHVILTLAHWTHNKHWTHDKHRKGVRDMNLRLVLASASPRRRELLAKLGIPFQVVVPAGVDESDSRGNALRRSVELAIRKAEAGRDQLSGCAGEIAVVGCDTLVALDAGGREEIIGKPRDRKHAREILTMLSGKTHRVVSGVAVARPNRATEASAEVSEVSFRELTCEEVECYVNSGDADGKAGAYGIQSLGSTLVTGFRGCYYNIVGLPLTRLATLLPSELNVTWKCDCEEHPLQLGGSCGI